MTANFPHCADSAPEKDYAVIGSDKGNTGEIYICGGVLDLHGQQGSKGAGIGGGKGGAPEKIYIYGGEVTCDMYGTARVSAAARAHRQPMTASAFSAERSNVKVRYTPQVSAAATTSTAVQSPFHIRSSRMPTAKPTVRASAAVKAAAAAPSLSRTAQTSRRPAAELNDDFTVTVTSNGQSGTFTYSPLTYCYKSANSQTADVKLQNVVKAIYLYWLEADKYFDQGGN